MYETSRARRALAEVGLQEGLGADEVHSRLRVALRLGETGQRILAFYLNEVDLRRLHPSWGCSSTAHYAEDRLGLDRRRTSELLAAARKLLTLPAIDRAFCEQQIGWSKVTELLKVATPEHEEEWLQRAKERTCRALRLEVRRARPGSAPHKSGEANGLPEVRYVVHTSVDALTFEKLETNLVNSLRSGAVTLSGCPDNEEASSWRGAAPCRAEAIERSRFAVERGACAMRTASTEATRRASTRRRRHGPCASASWCGTAGAADAAAPGTC